MWRIMRHRKATILLALASLTMLPAATSAPSVQFDGRYRGQRTVTRGDEPTCRKAGTTTLTVKDGVFSLTYARNTFGAPVAADGSFEVTKLFNAGQRTVSASLRGRISGRALEADLETYRCKYHFALTRQ